MNLVILTLEVLRKVPVALRSGLEFKFKTLILPFYFISKCILVIFFCLFLFFALDILFVLSWTMLYSNVFSAFANYLCRQPIIINEPMLQYVVVLEQINQTQLIFGQSFCKFCNANFQSKAHEIQRFNLTLFHSLWQPRTVNNFKKQRAQD